MSPQLASRVERWLAFNDPETATEFATADVANVRALTASAIGAEKPVVSNAALVGVGAEEAQSQGRQIKELLSKKDNEEGLRRFRNSPLNGCTSILTMARVAAGFNPLEPLQVDNAAAYANYVRRVAEAPFFNLNYANQLDIHRESNDWSVLINAVSDTFEGIVGADKDRLTNGLTALAEAATSRKNTRQTENLFVQSVLQADGKSCSAYVYSSNVTLEESSSKGSTSRQADFDIRRAHLIFRQDEWPTFAQKVWDKLVTTVDDWLNDNSTKPGDQPAKLCIG